MSISLQHMLSHMRICKRCIQACIQGSHKCPQTDSLISAISILLPLNDRNSHGHNKGFQTSGADTVFNNGTFPVQSSCLSFPGVPGLGDLWLQALGLPLQDFATCKHHSRALQKDISTQQPRDSHLTWGGCGRHETDNHSHLCMMTLFLTGCSNTAWAHHSSTSLGGLLPLPYTLLSWCMKFLDFAINNKRLQLSRRTQVFIMVFLSNVKI